MVAWTNAPRLAALVMVQPEFAADVPAGPVSWYGVARPRALSGFAGTMMSQLGLFDDTAATAGAFAAGAFAAPAAEHWRTGWPSPRQPSGLCAWCYRPRPR